MKDILIEGKRIRPNSPIFLIAEAGVNHNGELSLAKKLIDIVANAEVDAIKFQTFITEQVFIKSTPKVEYLKSSKDDKQSWEEMVKKYEFTKEDFIEIKKYCEKKKIIFLSTPYDENSIEWLEDLNIAAYKISSGDLTNYPLLKKICSKKKPILLSTGMATLKEVIETVNFIYSNNIHDLCIFQCTTNYPSSFEELNLNVIETYKKEFPDCLIGFSDHSLGIEASIGAASKGVKLIEKHITLDREMDGPDHKASLDPEQLNQWVKSIRNIEKALGTFEKFPSKTELIIAEKARRSIVSRKLLEKGKIIKKEDLIVKRPGYGIPPTKFNELLGKRTKRSIPEDTIINWDDIEEI